MSAPTPSSEVEDFLESPLVTWFRSCLDDPAKLTEYDDLSDGLLIYQVLLLIDPEPVHSVVGPSLGNPALRSRNIDAIIRNIKNLYEEELGQFILVLPDSTKIGRDPESKDGLEQMQLLLLLLLGCAVQCPTKQRFIEQIKSLPIDAQHALVHWIRQVTESQELVLTQEGQESVSNELLINHIKRLVKQRDQVLLGLGFNTPGSNLEEKKISQGTSSGLESQHLAVELADWKSKLRKQRQELEEKSEALVEAREELEHNKALVAKLRNEIGEVKAGARVWKAYRDEADALRERAERCERLEVEVSRYREKLSDLEFYKSRVEELREDNRLLEETREMLESQLARARARVEYTAQLEATIAHHTHTIQELSIERDARQEKLQELFEENAKLAILSKSALHSTSSLSDSEQINESTSVGDNSLSEQLSNSAEGRALRLELENKRLTAALESLQEATLNHSSDAMLQLEKDKKKLEIQVEELEGLKKKYMSHVSETETKLKSTQRDLQKANDLNENLQNQIKNINEKLDIVTKEKSRQEERIEELEDIVEKARQEAEQLHVLDELKSKSNSLEKELSRLKVSLENSSTDVDKLQGEVEALRKERSQLCEELEESRSQSVKLQDAVRDMRELESKYKIDRETLSNLQKDLVSEKLHAQQLQLSLERLGLSDLSDPELAIKRIITNPEVLNAVRERLGVESNDLAAVAARLEVDVATQQSQISSLSSQLTALQLANSQLVAEKEEVNKELENLRREHQQLLLDHLTLQSLHEQLSTQYEGLAKERDMLKNFLRDQKSENKLVKETLEKVMASKKMIEEDRDSLQEDKVTLGNLRTEHSKLKDDFRNLFTGHDKLKQEYRNAQEEYRKMKAEVRRLDLSVTELQGELAMSSDHIAQQDVHISKLLVHCDMLKQDKYNLQEDRKSLMDHVTLLLGQYHELLTHSLEDKEQYHQEEKLFRDRVNDLCRQKEKLEEKIMEHYKKMESSHLKKKSSITASLVRKMKKAGSDIINKGMKWSETPAARGGTGTTTGTDSDTSLEDVKTKQDGFSLATPGSRRTLYLSAEDNSQPNNDRDRRHSVGGEELSSTSGLQQQDPSLLVYNRITAVMGGTSTPLPPAPGSTTSSKRQSTPKHKNDVWYEYGCV